MVGHVALVLLCCAELSNRCASYMEGANKGWSSCPPPQILSECNGGSSMERAAEDVGQKCCINMLGLTAHMIVLISAKGEHSLNEQERIKIDEE